MDSDHCFVMIPYEPTFEQVNTAIEAAVKEATDDEGESLNLQFRRADTPDVQNEIPKQIRDEIEQSRLCIAVLTDANPNVFWELGYAHAKDKPVILLSEDPESAPFDVRHMRIVRYSTSDTRSLKDQLIDAIRATIKVGTPISLLSKMITPKNLSSLNAASLRSAATKKHDQLGLV